MKLKTGALLLTAALLLASPGALALTLSGENACSPSGLASSGEAVLATDVYNKVIWRIEDGKASLYAGLIPPSLPGREPEGVCADGPAGSARFAEPWGIAPYKGGYAVTDAAANVVRLIKDGAVDTLAGSGEQGSANGMGVAASFDRPTGIAAAENGYLDVSDTGSGKIRCISTSGAVFTVAAGLLAPTGLCWSDGALYIAETGGNRIMCLKNGTLKAVAGSRKKAAGFADGPVKDALLESPQGVTVVGDAIFIADTGNSAVRCLKSGQLFTVAAAGDDELAPVKPRGLLVKGELLLTADVFSGQITENDIPPAPGR